jgi:hypothetical protein
MAYAVDSVIDKVIGIVIVCVVFSALASLVLNAFTNLSGAGLALGILFATILPLLFAVFVWKAIYKLMK